MGAYDKPDFWSQKARKEGYPARSVYKLRELDEKFGLFRQGGRHPPSLANVGLGAASGSTAAISQRPCGTIRPRILDLGAAPGSWSLYVLRKFPPAGMLRPPWMAAQDYCLQRLRCGSAETPLLLAAVDLLPLSRAFDKGLFDREDFFFLQADFTQAEVREALCSRGPYSLVLSDAAPATTGNRALDVPRSLALAEEALSYAEAALERGGALVVKVFQGGETAGLLARLKELFATVKTFKPKACRSDSFETYCAALGKRA